MYQLTTGGLDLSVDWSDQGILMTPSGHGIGAVCAIEAYPGAPMVLVRKAARAGYEFSNLLALPGGMIRLQDQTDVELAIRKSLVGRIKAECGLTVGEDAIVPMLRQAPPPLTSYVARGSKRFTIVLGFTAAVGSEPTVTPTDDSISDAQWASPTDHWSDLAPANCLILARHLRPVLDERGRAKAREPLEAALASLRQWAIEVGYEPPDDPWPLDGT